MHSIKKAYRKKALELHPDRNYGNVEDTTKLFAEVQSAYDVLSDPQERAWYDSHRDAILRDDSEDTGEHYEHNLRMTTANDIMRMFTRFNGRIDFSDSPSGFYGLLRDTFDVLTREEEVACDWGGLRPVEYPSFGHSNDSYEDVVRPFYVAWNGFATKKSFSWKDVFRYSDAPDRRIRRMMEKENKRFRDEGIREFNDVVRSLVAFVRKRDPRYIPNSQSEADRQKVLRDAAAAQAARSRAANQVKLEEYVLPEWTKIQDSEKAEDSEKEGSAEEHYECVACGKTFKSEKQFEAHERSKKHMKAVQQLRKMMQKDDEALQLDDAVSSDIASSSAADREKQEILGLGNDGENIDSKKESHQTHHSAVAGVETELDDESMTSRLRSLDKPPIKTGLSDPDSSSDSDEYAPREEVESRMLGSEDAIGSSPKEVGEVANATRGLSTNSLSHYSDAVPQPQVVGKAKGKRAKKTVQKTVKERCGTEVEILSLLPSEYLY